MPALNLKIRGLAAGPANPPRLSRRTSNCQIGQKVGLLSHDVSTANVPVKPKSVTN